MTPAQAILSGCIDYAGMFPPASLDLQTTVANYAAYQAGGDGWALGPLILPLRSVEEFTRRWPQFAQSWRVSAIVRAEDSPDELAAFLDRLPRCISAVEFGSTFSKQGSQFTTAMPPGTSFYFEVDLARDLEQTIRRLAEIGGRAKIRTGGTTPESIPSCSSVAEFISSCIRHQVSFKATAGLHHPVRGEHPLTYAPEAERADMHGFVNVLAASALLAHGGDVPAAVALLEERSLDTFRFGTTDLQWREWSFSTQQLSLMRRRIMTGFGSCSFNEPLQAMREGGLIA